MKWRNFYGTTSRLVGSVRSGDFSPFSGRKPSIERKGTYQERKGFDFQASRLAPGLCIVLVDV